jgi:hypothetical protein
MRLTGSLVFACAVLASPVGAGQAPPAADPAAPAQAPAATSSAASPEAATPAVATAPESAPPAATAPAAATPSSATPPADVVPDRTLPAKTDITIDRRSQVVAGIGFGGPLGGTFRLDLLHGLGADVREEKEHVTATCALPIPYCAGGFVLGAEAGSGGGKLSLGVGANARVQSEDFHGTVGVGLKASLARTWGNPIGTEPGLTYLGPELDLYVLRFGVGLGVLWRVSGSGGSSALFTWGVGVRL